MVAFTISFSKVLPLPLIEEDAMDGFCKSKTFASRSTGLVFGVVMILHMEAMLQAGSVQLGSFPCEGK